MMEFLQDLQEARMTRNSHNVKVLTYNDCKEKLYLTLLVVELLRQYPSSNVVAKAYSRKSSQYDNYNHFRMNGTDLSNLIYFINGDSDALDKLKDPGAAKRVRAQTTLPTMAVNRYLSQVSSGGRVAGVSEMFLKLESALGISNTDYKQVRRILTNYKTSSAFEKKSAVSKLMLAARAKLRNSDIIDDLEKLNADRDLEIAVQDNEPTISTPDIDTGLSLANYRYLVGTENIWLAKKFVEMSTKQVSVPANIIRGYLPVIKMITEIVQAGPAYVQMLRTVHQRAKKNLK